MHSFARHLHGATPEAQDKPTKGLLLKGGWRYDLSGWFMDTFLFRGQWRALRKRTIALAHVQPGDQVLDVGCGTGTLALEVARLVGNSGRVTGIDPSTTQIARAHAKSARRHLPAEFQLGVIEQIPFPDETFDAVFSTLMMHHLPAPLKRQGLAEISRVLKPGGRLIIADFTRKQDRQHWAAKIRAGGSRIEDLVALVSNAGFIQVETQEMPSAQHSAFPGASIVTARKAT